ncbi:MAG: putative glycosyltransferase, exosortase G system-associated [Atopobiaceae bacterium]|jgi:putative glycosyltransferase (exosortase G-associated)|nr:putative glycosyltransferase, exosortase G system-associated [Atopobiaceae bacterium]MCH4119616.1 putative glycosyltransferase, exosortase G system-associated [Atopobiaceae bacterium]MCI1318216.1 putative glycosyltransferase, exosortase G system-associated [Atopobiaceae bacterium]MCI1388687.1 putative glycosyltransferase, exosortase G system-associated [Atopobiaceae bacterium]MCI1432693.1 putative glycosyltransferase, exosortase G system-associated [Atopobiaceae bacterium]
MATAQSLLNSIIFWSAWIIIPVIVEIIPSIASVVLLIKRRISSKNERLELSYAPDITLIIPVYNSADSLEACIASVEASTYPNERIQIFLVDNGSTDDSFKVYSRCQRLYPDIHMSWMVSAQGKSKALNQALYSARGAYIINIDSDGVLDEHALENLIARFESSEDINCMTGAILTRPDRIMAYKNPFSRLFRRLEFMEYAQAFLAGRSYASEINAVYTLSGAFSAFRKSAILGSWMYNTSTISEDTHVTFQMRYLYHQRVEMCDNAIIFVDPIESLDKLYTQRQRWQRGSLEVAHLFGQSKLTPWRLGDVNVHTLLFDHTFAFPRLIWYVALICLMALNVSALVIFLSILLIFALYIVVGYLYFICVAALLRMDKPLRRFYLSNWWVVMLLPFYNLGVFFIRLAGIINSVNTSATWKTRTLTEEGADFRRSFFEQLQGMGRPIVRLRRWVNDRDDAFDA